MSNDDAESVERLQAWCRDVSERGADRVVVRWIDEVRPVADEEGEGVTVREVSRATLKAAPDGDDIVTETFEGIPHLRLRSVVDDFEFDVFYRNDNYTR